VKTLRRNRSSGCTAATKACEFRRWGGNHTRPACCTSHLVELTFSTHDLLTRHGITHWLDFGSLLGAVRGGELIPWDGDVDLGILEQDLGSILALASEVETAGHQLETVTQGLRINYSAVNTLHVDLFPWRPRDDQLEAVHRFDEWPGMEGSSGFPHRYIESLEPVMLHERPFPAPSPVHEFLKDHRYGPDYMKPVRQPWLRVYPTVAPEEMTPVVERILGLISDADAHLLSLLRSSRLAGRVRAVWLWNASGLPVAPDRRRLERLSASVVDQQPSRALDQLFSSLALLEQAIDELEHRRLDTLFRRAYRRLVRAREVALAVLARREHRAGFPFGI
jgi:hypothetical protein